MPGGIPRREDQRQPLHGAEGREQHGRELDKQRITPEDSEAYPKLVLCDTENQAESAVLGGDSPEGDSDLERRWARERTALDKGAWRSGFELPG